MANTMNHTYKIVAVIAIAFTTSANAETQIGRWCESNPNSDHNVETVLTENDGRFHVTTIFGPAYGTDPRKTELYKQSDGLYKLSDGDPKYKIAANGDLIPFDFFGALPPIKPTVGDCVVATVPKIKSTSKKTATDPLGVGQAELDKLIGNKIPYQMWDEWGNPQTLPGTNNSQWVVYLPKANISFISNKKTDTITFANFGKGAEAQAKKVPDWIKKQFSSWDGSHRKLTKYIKKQMNDPGSYKHVKTVYTIDGDGLFVTTTFRGTNAFNATVTERMSAKVDRNGNVIEANLQ